MRQGNIWQDQKSNKEHLQYEYKYSRNVSAVMKVSNKNESLHWKIKRNYFILLLGKKCTE